MTKLFKVRLLRRINKNIAGRTRDGEKAMVERLETWENHGFGTSI